MSDRIPKEYDLAYRDLFSHPELVEDLLRHYVHEPWVAELDFPSLQREHEVSIVRRKGAKVRDVVWSVRFNERTLYILILIEFQARPSPIMALRQLIYVATIYEDLYRQKRFTPSGKLPPVLPIVLYNGDRKWRAPLAVEEMIEPAPEALARYQPRLSYFLLDERRTCFRLGEAERNTVAAVLALEQSSEGQQVFEAICFLLGFLREPQHESLRQAFKAFIVKTLAPELAPIAEIFDHPEDPMTTRQRLQNWFQKEQATSRAAGRMDIVKTLAPELAPSAEGFDHAEDPTTTLQSWFQKEQATSRAEGRQEGVQEGVRKGVKKGRAEGQRSLLAKLLRLKFGALDEAAQARLDAASIKDLELWAERVLTASSLEEIWD